MSNLAVVLRRTALLLGACSIFLVSPPDSFAQRSQTISGPFTDISARALSSEARRTMLEQAIEASGIDAPRGAVDAVMRVYDRQPDVEIVVFDPASGRVFPAQLEGRATFSIGDVANGQRVCGTPCAGFDNARRLTLERINGKVTGRAVGSVDVSIAKDSRAVGVLDPTSGQAYVEWPVRVRASQSELFEQGFTADVVFRGVGQLTDNGFLVVDVASIPMGNVEVFTSNTNCINGCNDALVPISP